MKDFVVSESKGGHLGGLNEFVGKSWLYSPQNGSMVHGWFRDKNSFF